MVAEGLKALHLGDNCIQNFHLGRYIAGYTVGNLVLRRRAIFYMKKDKIALYFTNQMSFLRFSNVHKIVRGILTRVVH